MPIEIKEVFYSVRIEMKKLIDDGFLIPEVVLQAIDNLELEYARNYGSKN